MNKNEIYEMLNNRKIWYEVTEHKAVYNMEELDSIDLPYKDCDAKNLFVRDDKKKNYYLITVRGKKKVNLKEFKNKYNMKNLSLSSEEDLFNILNLTRGSVTPFGLLNDKDKKVVFYLDSDFKNDDIIGIHPNANTATIWIKVKDLIDIIEEHGNTVNTYVS